MAFHRARRVVRVLALCLVLSLIIPAAVSCGGGVGGRVADMMKRTPAQAAWFAYSNAEQMAGDSELHRLLDAWKAEVETALAFFGVDVNDVEHAARFADSGGGSAGNETMIVVGDFELSDVRKGLRDRSFIEKDFKMIEAWESGDGQFWAALPEEGLLIVGPKETVKESIRVIDGSAPSLYDDQDARDVIGRLAGGFRQTYAVLEGSPYTGLLAGGASFDKSSSTVLSVDMDFKFDEPESATAALDGLAEDEDEVYLRVNAEQDGRYVVIRAEANIADIVWPPVASSP